mmetsp:Transcript_37403/g.121658  ORF Transcript_37403/g.121658 Transcript_37403/m.121658 type:complete len:202 (+) Transcript_37403:1352-1957(+)
MTPLHLATESGVEPLVALLLERLTQLSGTPGADVDAIKQLRRGTVQFLAARHGFAGVLDLLRDDGGGAEGGAGWPCRAWDSVPALLARGRGPEGCGGGAGDCSLEPRRALPAGRGDGGRRIRRRAAGGDAGPAPRRRRGARRAALAGAGCGAVCCIAARGGVRRGGAAPGSRKPRAGLQLRARQHRADCAGGAAGVVASGA